MDLKLYIKGVLIDLFEDEKVSLNLSVKNVSDLSKLFTDFSQGFSIPCTPNNNSVFEYWFEADVDGTFNSNIRVEAYIEINSLPFRFGVVQLESCKMKMNQPYSYACTFYGNLTNLSDLFGDDELSSLSSLESFNHPYNSTNVISALRNDNLSNGDVYYPIINAINEMSLQTGGNRDLENSSNTISYREFKPALRVLRIIEAIETRYGITFSRDFFDRSIFYNLFLWLQKEEGFLNARGKERTIDIQNDGNFNEVDAFVNLTTDTVFFTPYEVYGTQVAVRSTSFLVSAQPGFESVKYKLLIYKNGVKVSEKEGTGLVGVGWSDTQRLTTPQNFQYKIIAYGDFEYRSSLYVTRVVYNPPSPFPNPLEQTSTIDNTSIRASTAILDITGQMPEIKVLDFINGLVKMFNLVIIPTSLNSFYLDTLDNWYSKGKTYNITNLVNIEDIEIKRPDVKKKIFFKYEKAEAILGDRYFQNNKIGYGDLKALFNIQGDDLEIDVPFENMLFERLTQEAGGTQTALQVGFAIDKELSPVKTAPLLFYRNGTINTSATTYIQPSNAVSTYFHTATEDNLKADQITNSLNFGSDISSYFFTPIEKSLYFNFWKTYIEDLFNKKCRVIVLKCKLPISILLKLKINDKFIVRDKRYKISSINVDLTNGQANLELFTDFSQVSDPIDNKFPLTVDNTEITVDSESVTVDQTEIYSPLYSYITNGISLDSYVCSSGEENFELKITTAFSWSVVKIDTGNGVDWFNSNKNGGSKSDFLRIKVNKNPRLPFIVDTRSGILRVIINGVNFDLTITQV